MTLRTLFAAATIGLTLGLSACATSIDDARADANLKGRLFSDREHDYGDLDITIYGGRLMLTGSMRTQEGRAHAVDIARRTPNIDEVVDEIVVGDPTGMGQGARDAYIDERLEVLLLSDGGVKRTNYEIAVSDGAVYLLGVARTQAELERVVGHARTISGVERVVSHVRLRIATPD